MTEEHVIRYCAPTLACIKTGSIFSCAYSSSEDMYNCIRAYNRRLHGKGLRILPLRYRNGKGLIYIYRPDRLSSDLSDQSACVLLQDHGYPCGNANCCIRRLIERFSESDEFPHEIGLFLSYPPGDVHGFIHRKNEAKYCGCWKVYEDVDSAIRTFERYKKCSDIYMKMWSKGHSIEQLTVAV